MKPSGTNILDSFVQLSGHSCNFSHRFVFKLQLNTLSGNEFDLLSKELKEKFEMRKLA